MASKEKKLFDWGLTLVFLLAFLVPITYPFVFAKVIPMTVGGFGLALMIWEIVATRKAGEETSAAAEQPANWRVILTWLALLGVMVYFFGILITIPLYMFAYLRFKGGDKWVTAIVNSAVTTVIFYVVFVFALEAQLYRGLIWETIRRYW